MTATPIRILLLEDNPADARLVALLLSELDSGYSADRFDVVCVTRLEDALRLLQVRTFDASLVDLSLPDSTGLQTLHSVLQAAPSLPVVILSGLGDEAISIEAVKSGAQDYLVKGSADSRLIINAIRYAIERKQRAQTLEAIADVTREMRNAWTIQEILERIVDRLCSLFGVVDSVATLVTPESGEQIIRVARGRFAQAVGASFVATTGYTGEVQTTDIGVVTTLPDYAPTYASPDLPNNQLEAAGAPLIVDGAVLGGLWLFRNHTPGEPLTFNADDQTALLAVADITASAVARARLLAATQGQKEQLQTVVDTVADGLTLLDDRYHILLANQGANEHLARLAITDEFSGALITLAGVPIEDVVRAAQGQDPYELHLEPDSLAIYEARTYPISGKPATRSWLLSLRDVTDERRRHARQEQQARMAAVGQMAAGIAHQFNNSLASIVLYSDLLIRNRDISQDDQRRLQIILREARTTADLVQQLLDFSHQALVVRSHFDLVPFIARLLDIWAHTLPETIVVAFECSDAVKLVRADPTRLQQALMNLVVFAEKSMPTGGTLWLAVESQLFMEDNLPLAELVPGPYAVISLQHSGTPIPESVLRHIFEPFFVSEGVNRLSGLSLAQVYGIIAQHEGTITATNTATGETVFTIYLPLALESLAPQDAPPPTAPQPHYATTLIVLEKSGLLRQLQIRLSGHGQRVLTSTTGLDALRRYSVDLAAVDLVVTSPSVGDISGDELWEIIREIAPNARAIFLTDDPMLDVTSAPDVSLPPGQATWQPMPLEGSAFSATLTKLVDQILSADITR